MGKSRWLIWAIIACLLVSSSARGNNLILIFLIMEFINLYYQLYKLLFVLFFIIAGSVRKFIYAFGGVNMWSSFFLIISYRV